MEASGKQNKLIYIRWFFLRLAMVLFDIFAVNFSYFIALILRFYVNFEINVWAVRYIPAFLKFAPWYTVCCLLIFWGFKLYNNRWKYAGLNDLNRILLACLVTCVVQVVGSMMFVLRMPITYYVIGAVIQFCMIAVSRFSYRLFLMERSRVRSRRSAAAIPVMIVGVGETSHLVRRHLERDTENAARPVCLADFRGEEFGNLLEGLPVVSGVSKIADAIKKYGATVTVVDGNYDDAVIRAAKDAEENGWYVVSDTSWDGYTEIPTWIMQGYTSMLLECQEQFAGMGIQKPTHVFVQAGVGALAGAVVGFYTALFQENPPLFVIVEPDKAPCVYESIKAGDGKCHSVKGDLDTIMAGLACGDPSPLAFKILNGNGDVFMEVPDYIAARGMRILSCPLKGDPFIISGESGAVPLGALYSLMTENTDEELKNALGLNEDSLVFMINTEGNTDPKHFRRIIWDGQDPVPREYRTRR